MNSIRTLKTVETIEVGLNTFCPVRCHETIRTSGGGLQHKMDGCVWALRDGTVTVSLLVINLTGSIDSPRNKPLVSMARDYLD